MPLSATLPSPSDRAHARLKSTRRVPCGPYEPEMKGRTGTSQSSQVEGEESARLSDEALLSRYRDTRRPEVFNELFHRYSGPLSRYLARYLGHTALAEDVLQDTFFQIHIKCGLYRDGWPARPWLYAIAVHRAADALRRTPRLKLVSLDRPLSADERIEPGSLVEMLASAEPGPLEELQDQERQRWVRDCVARLSGPLRQALILSYYQGLSYSEIAQVLGVPLGTIKSRLHCAIARLRAIAEEYEWARTR